MEYRVLIRPLRLESAGLVAGHEYCIHFARRGFTAESNSQPCMFSGELVFSATPAQRWTTMDVTFRSTDDMRNVDVSMDDVTSRRGKVPCMASVKLPLGAYVSTQSGESMNRVVEVGVRVSGSSGSLAIQLMMHPQGSHPPPPPQAEIERLLSVDGPQGGVGRTTTLAPAVATVLVSAQLITADEAAKHYPLDIAEQLSALVAQFNAYGSASAAGDSNTIKALTDEIDGLEGEVAIQEKERLRLERQLAAGNSQPQQGAPAGDAESLRAIQSDVAALERQLHGLDDLYAAEMAKKTGSRGPDVGGITPPYGSESDESPSQMSPVDLNAATELDETITEVQGQLADAQRRMAELEREQLQRDVTTEAVEVLEVIGNLESLITELQEQRGQMQGQQQHAQPAAGKRKKRKKVRFADDSSGESGAQSPSQEGADDPVVTIIEARGRVEALRFGLRGAIALQRGDKVAALPPLSASSEADLTPAASAAPHTTTSAAAPPSLANPTLDDLFGGAPTPAAPQPAIHQPAAAPDLFSHGAPPAAESQAPPAVTGLPPLMDAPSSEPPKAAAWAPQSIPEPPQLPQEAHGTGAAGGPPTVAPAGPYNHEPQQPQMPPVADPTPALEPTPHAAGYPPAQEAAAPIQPHEKEAAPAPPQEQPSYTYHPMEEGVIDGASVPEDAGTVLLRLRCCHTTLAVQIGTITPISPAVNITTSQPLPAIIPAGGANELGVRLMHNGALGVELSVVYLVQGNQAPTESRMTLPV